MAREVELKMEFVGQDWERVKLDLLRRPDLGGLTAGPARTRLVLDRYWDTDDQRLLAHKIGLRVRTEGLDRRLQLKYGDRAREGVFSRFELDTQLDAAGWEMVLAELCRLGIQLSTPGDIPALALDEPVPGFLLVLSARSHRQERLLSRDGKDELVLTVDEVRYHGVPGEYRDVEVEALVEGADPEPFGQELSRLYPGQWRRAILSKLARGLRAVQERNSITSPSSRE